MKYTPRDKARWHEWFAWRPVLLDGPSPRTWVWLERIERRRLGMWMMWGYRVRVMPSGAYS